MTMIQIINEFKIASFLNLKLILISLILIISTSFGIKSINNIVKSNDKFSEKIIYNEKSLLKIIKSSDELSKINNKTLLLCLDGRYDSLSYINSIKVIKENLNINKKSNYKLDSLFTKKLIIFNKINEKNSDNEYLIINSDSISIQTRVILSDFYELRHQKNLKEYKILQENIDSNLHKYFLIIFSLLIIYSILVLMIINDIKFKNRLENRDKYIISILIDRIKIIMNR